MAEKIPVAILGATGIIGQRFIQLLNGHPWFQVVALTGSEHRAGKVYSEACRWVLPEPMPGWAAGMPLLPTDPAAVTARLVFSALPTETAREIEPEFARAGALVSSNASAFRSEADVPLLLPEVNPEHAALLEIQRQKRGWRGGLITNPNCTSSGLTVALKALQQAFGLRRAFAVSLQALSGGGYPGVASLDVIDNVLPFIGGEEEKLESEPRKMLGELQGEAIAPAGLRLSAHTNRVPVSDGHLVCLSVELEHRASPQEAGEALAAYRAPEPSACLPSAPKPAILVRAEADRPQPRLDRQTGGGMTTVVGRVRADPLFDVKMVVLTHNTIRGAAGGAIYNAELLVRRGELGEIAGRRVGI